jgi:hypothetical protein
MPSATPDDVEGLGRILATLGATEVHTIVIRESISETCSEIVRLADAIGFERYRKICTDEEAGLCFLKMMGAKPITAAPIPPRHGPQFPASPYVGPSPWKSESPPPAPD